MLPNTHTGKKTMSKKTSKAPILSFNYPSKSFIDYLQSKRITSSDENMVTTHMSMSQPYGKFHIPKNEIQQFMELYEEEIKKGSTLGIVEKPLSHMDTPLVCDIDFKYKFKDSYKGKPLEQLRKHDFLSIKKIVEVYKNIYNTYFTFDKEEDKRQCYFVVSQRESPYIVEKNGDKIIKDGIHIMNFGYRANPQYHQHIRSEILQNKELQEMFQQFENIHTISDIIDEQVISKNGWLLYGSTKPERTPYKVEYILDHNLCESTKDEIGIVSYPKYLSYWRDSIHAHPIKNTIDTFFTTYLKPSHKKWEEGGVTESKENVRSEEKETQKKKHIQPIQVLDFEECYELDENRVSQVQNLVQLFSKRRATNEKFWKELGECLFDISDGHEKYLDIWKIFTCSYNKFTEEDCNNFWEKQKQQYNFSISTLKFWAYRDDQKGYERYTRNVIRKFLMRCINTTHVDVSKTLFYMYENQYVCSSIKNNTWYEFKKHRWNKVESGITLRRRISKELAIEYLTFKKFCSYMINNADDEEFLEKTGYVVDEEDNEFFSTIEPENWRSMSSICDDVVMKCKTKGYKDSLLGEAKDFFYQADFEEKLDEKHELVGFENGVIDLNKRIFRDGRPDDFITLSTKTKYNGKYKNTEQYKEIMEFLEQIYLTKEMVEYGLKERAVMLHGDNYEERIYTHIGAGGNGKSKWREACSKALGDYVFGFPVTLFTGKLSASSTASPEVARSKGKRMAYVDEPEHNSHFNIGLAKKFSGGDPIETRKLFGDMFEFIPQFSMTLLCNNIPGFPAHDEGAQRRLTITQYCARFIENPKEKYEFKRDNNLSTKIKQWGDVLASLLVDYFYIYKDEGLKPPTEVTKFTKQFMQECDMYNEFISDTIIPDEENAFILIKDLYERFKQWVEENGVGSRRLMSLREFKKYIQKKIPNPESVCENKIFGYSEKM